MSDSVRCICTSSFITRTCPKHDPLSDEQKAALERNGYDPAAAPRGVTGDPGFTFRDLNGTLIRNRVCYLDGVKIEGHSGSDIDYCGCCIHCDYECEPCKDDS
jgi:hypothetical protein